MSNIYMARKSDETGWQKKHAVEKGEKTKQ